MRDPHRAGSWGLCPSSLLGVWCPGCGGLRAVNDLTHGDLAAAASSNLLLVLLAPAALALLAVWTVRRWQARPLRGAATVPGWSVGALLTLVAAFTVLRNLPGAWLAP